MHPDLAKWFWIMLMICLLSVLIPKSAKAYSCSEIRYAVSMYGSVAVIREARKRGATWAQIARFIRQCRG